MRKGISITFGKCIFTASSVGAITFLLRVLASGCAPANTTRKAEDLSCHNVSLYQRLCTLVTYIVLEFGEVEGECGVKNGSCCWMDNSDAPSPIFIVFCCMNKKSCMHTTASFFCKALSGQPKSLNESSPLLSFVSVRIESKVFQYTSITCYRFFVVSGKFLQGNMYDNGVSLQRKESRIRERCYPLEHSPVVIIHILPRLHTF